MEPGGIDAEGDTVDAIHAAARELARGEVARGEGGVDDPADVPHVPLDTAHDGAPDRPLARATRQGESRQVRMIEPDDRHLDVPPGVVHHPGREVGRAHLDQVGPLAIDDPADRPGRQQEPVARLEGNRRPAQLVPPAPRLVVHGVVRPGGDEHLTEPGMVRDEPPLLQQIGADAATRRAEVLRDVEHAERGVRAKPLRRWDHDPQTSAGPVTITSRSRAGSVTYRRKGLDRRSAPTVVSGP